MENNVKKAFPWKHVAIAALLVVAFLVGYIRGQNATPEVDPTPAIEQGDPTPVPEPEPEPTSTPQPEPTPTPAPEPEPEPTPTPEPSGTYELVFYPAQEGVDPDDVFVYGEPVGVPSSVRVTRGGEYTSMEEVALYIHTFGTVPPNFISKTKARNAGWVAEEGNLWEVLPGMSIGGGGWHNDEAVMPGAYYDQWYECDIDYEGGYRGPERLVYSDNGMIFYTPDHYESYARIF